MSVKHLSQRQRRIGEEVRRALSEILQRGMVRHSLLAQTPITVTEVQVSPDIRYAEVYVLPLGGENTPDILKALNEEAGFLHTQLRAYMTTKYTPRLRFTADASFDYAARMERLISGKTE